MLVWNNKLSLSITFFCAYACYAMEEDGTKTPLVKTSEIQNVSYALEKYCTTLNDGGTCVTTYTVSDLEKRYSSIRVAASHPQAVSNTTHDTTKESFDAIKAFALKNRVAHDQKTDNA